MRTIHLLACAVVALALVGLSGAKSANAASWYVSLGGGAALVNDTEEDGIALEVDPGFAISGALGVQAFKKFCMEAELSYQQSNFSQISSSGVTLDLTGDVSSLGLFGNLYFDLSTSGRWKPYVGAGVGASRLKTTDVTTTVAGVTIAAPDTS